MFTDKSILTVQNVHKLNKKHPFNFTNNIDESTYKKMINEYHLDITKVVLEASAQSLAKTIFKIDSKPDEILNIDVWVREETINLILKYHSDEINEGKIITNFFDTALHTINKYKYCLTGVATSAYIVEKYHFRGIVSTESEIFDDPVLQQHGTFNETEIWCYPHYDNSDHEVYLFNDPIQLEIFNPYTDVDFTKTGVSVNVSGSCKVIYPEMHHLEIIDNGKLYL